MKENKRKNALFVGKVIYFIYLLVLIYLLFFSERYGRTQGTGEYRYNLVPFAEIKRYIIYSERFTSELFLINIVGNMLAFVPFGFLIPLINSDYRNVFKVSLLSMFFSTLVEVVQLLSKVGSFDVDDIILNTLGGFIGALIYYIINGVLRYKRKSARRK